MSALQVDLAALRVDLAALGVDLGALGVDVAAPRVHLAALGMDLAALEKGTIDLNTVSQGCCPYCRKAISLQYCGLAKNGIFRYTHKPISAAEYTR